MYQAAIFLGAITPDHGTVRLTPEQALSYYGPESKIGRMLLGLQ